MWVSWRVLSQRSSIYWSLNECLFETHLLFFSCILTTDIYFWGYLFLCNPKGKKDGIYFVFEFDIFPPKNNINVYLIAHTRIEISSLEYGEAIKICVFNISFYYAIGFCYTNFRHNADLSIENIS